MQIGIGLGLTSTLNQGVGADRFTSALPPSVSYSRTGTATAVNLAGAIIPFASNIAPITDRGMLVEPARTNVQARSDPLNAVAGSPGTAPTGWTISLGTTNGITRSIAGSGTDVTTGVPYVDVSYTGTATAAENLAIICGTAVNVTSASAGQAWSAAMHWAVISGTLPAPSTAMINGVRIRYGNPGILAQSGSSDTPSTTFATRAVNNNAIAPANTTVVGSDWLWSLAAGQAINCTIRFGAFQLEQGVSVSSYIQTTTAAATRGLPTITRTVPSGRTIARATYGLGNTVADITGLTPGASFDLVTGRPWTGLGNELKSLEWLP